MKKNKIKIVFLMIIFGIYIWFFSNYSQAAYVSISPNATSADPGQTVNLTISSDCVGRVNVSASNGSLSTNKVWIEGGSSTVSLTVGNSGETVVTITPENGMMSSGGIDIPVNGSSTAIKINNSTPVETPNTDVPSNNEDVTNNQNTENNQNTQNTEVTQEKKSSNANLSNLGIRPNDFSGFKSWITSYDITVPNDVETIEIYAKAQDSKAKISGIGSKKLEEGKNTSSIVVTAEDGTQKTYTINVTREENKDEDNDEENSDEEVSKGLSELKIEDLKLTPEFKTDIYEYKVDYIGDETKLNINTIATDTNYVVEVTGNEDLKEGENIITILVSDIEGNNIATYQVTVNKSLVNEEPMILESQNNNKMIIIGVILAVVILAIIIFVIIKYRRNKKWEEEYSMPFSGLEYDNDQLEDFDENMDYEEYDYYEEDEENQEIEEIDELEENEESLREQFLNNYNSDNDEYEEWEEEKPKRRHKGKRFK